MKVGLAGNGVIGAAFKEVFLNDLDVAVADRHEELEHIAGLAMCFIAVPTSEIRGVCKYLACHGTKLLCIVSTANVGDCQYIADKTHADVLYFPQFCDEDFAAEQMNEDGLLLGVDPRKYKRDDAFAWHPLYNRVRGVFSWGELELAKLATNAFYAVKVTFANEVADIAERYGIEYEEVRRVLDSRRYIAPNHLRVIHKGFRGFGGKCLPKDVKALMCAGFEKSYIPRLTSMANSLNEHRTTTLKERYYNE